LPLVSLAQSSVQKSMFFIESLPQEKQYQEHSVMMLASSTKPKREREEKT
jgi:hypothetical protein